MKISSPKDDYGCWKMQIRSIFLIMIMMVLQQINLMIFFNVLFNVLNY